MTGGHDSVSDDLDNAIPIVTNIIIKTMIATINIIF